MKTPSTVGDLLSVKSQKFFDDGNSPSGTDSTFTAFSSIPSVDTSVSGGSACDWSATPVSLPTQEEEYMNATTQRNGGTMNSMSPGLQIMVSITFQPVLIPPTHNG